MFRIVCDPSSGNTELYLTEITLSVSQTFAMCLVGVWQRNFEPVVCVYGTTGPAQCIIRLIKVTVIMHGENLKLKGT
jgi:hypothetical protein